jgi:hypothetical protein
MNADKGTIPPFESNITQAVDPLTLAPQDLRVREYLYTEGTTIRAGVQISWQVARLGLATAFEIQRLYEGSLEWVSLQTVPAPQTSVQLRNVDIGYATFRVRALFGTSGASDWATSQQILLEGIWLTPPDVTNFEITVLGDLAFLEWDILTQLNIDRYEVRYTPVIDSVATPVTWGSAQRLTDVRGNQTTVPSRVGTYLVKAVTSTGIYSRNAAMITTEIPNINKLNVIETLTESPSWPGAMLGVGPVNGRLQLSGAETLSDWANLALIQSLYLGTGVLANGGIYEFGSNMDIGGGIEIESIVISDDSPSVGQTLTATVTTNEAGTVTMNWQQWATDPPPASGSSGANLDLGAVYVSRVSSKVIASGLLLTANIGAWQTLFDVRRLQDADPDDWEVILEYTVTEDDPSSSNAVWSAWDTISLADLRFRAIRFRLRLIGNESKFVTPVVSHLSVVIDMPDRVEEGHDLVVNTTGRRINYAPPFRATPGTAISIQNAQTGDREEITNKTETGFDIRIMNSAGQPVQRTVDYVSKGYGQKLS